jgi:cobalamin-dependent methionine synthase I
MMVVTAGPGIGAASAGAMEAGRYTRGIFLDAIGSVAVESAADWVQERSLAAARKDPELYRYSERFSPGYCDWPLGEQKALLEAAGADLVDVTLNASMMMAPEKSVSAVFGIGKRVEYDGRRRPPCGECERAAGCSYRRAG